MRSWPVEDLLRDFAPSNADLPVTGLSLDSRAIDKGDLFLACAGTDGHGLEYVNEAMQCGAVAVAYEPPAPDKNALLNVTAIAVPELSEKAGLIADRFYAEPSSALRVIGITGTNGKTSCAYLLAQILTAAGEKTGLIGTPGSGLIGAIQPGQHTTPDAVTLHRRLREMLDAGATAVAMEVSSHALTQGRVNGVRFALAVFTNLSRDHLDYHADMESYAQAKSRLFDWPGLKSAVINTDDPFGRTLAAGMPGDLERLRYSLEDAAVEIRAGNLELHRNGLRFTLITPAGRAQMESALLGRFNVSNLLAVAGCLHAFGWAPERIAQHARALKAVPGRMERLPPAAGRPLVVIDYAHTPDALEQALAALRSHTRGRLTAVFGAGGERDTGKRAEMGRIAEKLADRVVLTDDNPRGEDAGKIIDAIRAGMAAPDRARVIQPRAVAVTQAIYGAGPNDVVLLAGKGEESWQQIGDQRMPYSERAVALTALGGMS